MATLTVWRFPTADGAEGALSTLKSLQQQQLITIQDAELVTWPSGARKPITRHLDDLTGAGALSGAFWGLLFGLLFFVPLLGAAVGAATGALIGHFTDVGIDNNFVDRVKREVTPGTSALFLLSSNEVVDRLADAFKGSHAELIASNLSQAQEAKLHEVFGKTQG